MAVVQNCALKMLTLPQQLKMNRQVAETTLLALVHMLRNFFALVTFDALALGLIQPGS